MMENYTYYDLHVANILLMKKRLQLSFTEKICYPKFVKITIDTDSLQKLLQEDLRKIDSEEVQIWVLYSKVPWEGYLNRKFKNRKE